MPKQTASRKTSKQPANDNVKFVESLKRQWLAMIDAIVDPIMIVSTDHKIIRANRSMGELANKDVKDIIGSKCHQTFAGKNKPCTGCKLGEAVTCKTATHWELEKVRTDRFFEVTSQPVYDDKGKVEGMVQVYRDRTDARQLQAKFLQHEKLASIGLLAGGVAHEINNPLGGIIIFSQMLMRELPKGTDNHRDAEEVFNAAQRCKTIVENLLDFARMRPAKKVEAETFDITDVAKSALRFGRVSDNARGIEIHEHWSSTPLIVTADKNKLIQVFLNLIQNGLQATSKGGSLTVRSFVENSAAVIEVEDTGSGIPVENQSKIFDPFFTTKDPDKGTGLGLSICYSIIQEFKGELSFESKVKKGTTFRVTLPLNHDIKAVS